MSEGLQRFAAHFAKWDGDEFFTDSPPAPGGQGGLVIYSKTIETDDDVNVLFVTISATGDVHGDSRLMLAANVDGLPANPGTPASSGTSGWVVVLRDPTDDHDNNVNYTWCTKVNDCETHTVEIRMASGDGGDVFLEAAHFFIDGCEMEDPENACSQA